MGNQLLNATAAEVRKEYFREWRKKNKDKVKQHNQNYWLRKAEAKLQNDSKNN